MGINNEFYCPDRQTLRTWLMKNHTVSTGVWIVHDKGERRRLTVRDITSECICFGWIDSKVGKVDDSKTKLYISPRSPKSNWSRVNKDIVSELEQANLLHSSGRAMIDLAKKNGTWTALDDVENLVIPDDLDKELRSYPKAHIHFKAFPRSATRGILEWILSAKTPETRAKRISETAKLAQDNIRANHYKPQ